MLRSRLHLQYRYAGHDPGVATPTRQRCAAWRTAAPIRRSAGSRWRLLPRCRAARRSTIRSCSIQGPNFGVLTCVHQPESCFQCFTFDEQQLLQATGFVVTVPLHGGTGHMTSPMIVNDITNNRYDDEGRLNATWWNTNSRRLAAATADSMAIALSQCPGAGALHQEHHHPARRSRHQSAAYSRCVADLGQEPDRHPVLGVR